MTAQRNRFWICLSATVGLLAGAGCGSSANPPGGVPPVDVATTLDAATPADGGSVMDALMDAVDSVVAPDLPAAVDRSVADTVAPDVPTLTDALDRDVAAMAGPYPPGPYGHAMGDVLANLSWEGYVNPTGDVVSTTLPYGPTSLQALRGTGRGYALVHVAEFY